MAGSRIQFRRGNSDFWEDENPILRPGEPGYEKNTRRLKIGDGVTHWRELPYFGGADEVPLELQDHINSQTPHPVYDDGPSLAIIYENAKV